MVTFSADELRRIGRDVLEAVGARAQEASEVAGFLVESNLVGHDSHGVIRLPQYVEAVESGKIDTGAAIEAEQETAGTAVLNGNWGFGHVTAAEAVRTAARKARDTAVGMVTVHRCNHVGRLGGYPPIAAAEGMVGLMTNNGHGGDLAMAPWGGVGRVLPANCVSMAFPSDRDYPVVLDLTTAVAAGGKVRVALARGERLPEGWLVDADGNPTTDPAVYVGDPPGALVPFGGPAGHKGSGLAFMLDILSGALSPAGCSRENPPVSGNALFVQAIRIEAFRPLDAFREEVGRLIDYVKSAPPAPGFSEVLVPGERSHRTRQERLADGIPLEDRSWERIRGVADRLGVDL